MKPQGHWILSIPYFVLWESVLMIIFELFKMQKIIPSLMKIDGGPDLGNQLQLTEVTLAYPQSSL